MLAWSTLAYGQAALDHEEFVGPFPSWSNVKTDFGAVGNGVADDTAALQKALDTFQQKSNVLYLPAGVYRITKGLTMTNRQCLSILGEDPAKTEIKWDGPEEGTMLLCNGVCYAKFAALPGTAAARRLPPSSTNRRTPRAWEPATSIPTRCSWIWLSASARASRTSWTRRPPSSAASSSAARKPGSASKSFNALDWFVWDSEFDGCAIGVTNDPGAGHFHVYRNIFRNSTVADIALRNAEYFGIRHNLSVGSKRFFEGRNIGGWAVPTMLQGNTIIETKEPVAILVNNPGPTLLIDNVIKSRADVTEGPVVRLVAGLDGEYVAVGNTFTVATPFIARHRFLELETKVVPAEKIVPPALPGAVTPPRKNRPVIEVPAKADGKAIQAAIDQAAAARGNRPMVHIAKGDYGIQQTIAIPAGLDVQIVGDGLLETTKLRWSGADGGTMFALAGPARATFRDLSLVGNRKGAGMMIAGADQPGARISGDGLDVGGCQLGLLVDGVEQTDVSFRDIHHHGNKVSFRVVGGPEAGGGKAGRPRGP